MNILVTGGTGGVGRAAVEALAAAGHRVWFTYCRAQQRARDMEREGVVTAVRCDFADAASVEALCAAMPAMQLDALVNNAWSSRPVGQHFHKLDMGDVAQVFAANVLPTLRITQAAVATFRKRKSGKIITVISSSAVGNPVTGCSLYSATKAYLLQMARCWAKEYIRYGVTSNCVSPDFMQTDFTADTDERVVEQMVQASPLRRLLCPAEVADVICHLATASQQVNGVNIVVNAGADM